MEQDIKGYFIDLPHASIKARNIVKNLHTLHGYASTQVMEYLMLNAIIITLNEYRLYRYLTRCDLFPIHTVYKQIYEISCSLPDLIEITQQSQGYVIHSLKFITENVVQIKVGI